MNGIASGLAFLCYPGSMGPGLNEEENLGKIGLPTNIPRDAFCIEESTGPGILQWHWSAVAGDDPKRFLLRL